MAAKKDDVSVKNISPKLGGERGTRNPKGPTSSHDLVEQMEFLYVQVNQAKNYSDVNPIPLGTIVEINLGNSQASTETLPFRGIYGEWEQVFAFDKTKADALSVTLKVAQSPTNTVIVGQKKFKLAADIPSRVSPDARIAAQWYTLQNPDNSYQMNLNMSVWFGTQADEVYSNAWFSDASHVNASCVSNTRPKLYVAPRICYVRVTIVSGHDLISNDGKRPPSVYLTVNLGNFSLKTGISAGPNPSWNQDLVFVTSEPFDDIATIKLIDRVDDQHEECIGILKKKLSEMTALKVPGSAPAFFYDIGLPVKVEPAGDTRRFSSTIKMKLAIDQAYHVSEECSLYASDYRAYAKGLWPGVIGKLEIGILGATGLTTMKEWSDGRKSTDAYVVAKYGNRWARTRTVVNSLSPKWNEQYSWDVYDISTVITFGLYDNLQILSSNNNQKNDLPIGKVRIPLRKLEWDRTYTRSIPILGLGKGGLKRSGELQLAFRLASVAVYHVRFMHPFRWMLPKAHYKSPLSLLQIKNLRLQAAELNYMNLARTEPPLRKEVVMDMLKQRSTNFSMRRAKANWERLYRIALMLYSPYAWLDATVISTTDLIPKAGALFVCASLMFFPAWILWIACWVMPFFIGQKACSEMAKLPLVEYLRSWLGMGTRALPPLNLFDLKLAKLESPNLDELAEEFDSFPSSEADVNVLKMRYDRMRKMGEKVMMLMGDLASQGERFIALLTFNGDPLASFYFWIIFYVILFVVYYTWYEVVLQKLFALVLLFLWLGFPCFRNSLPTGFKNFFRRLPTNEDLMF